jgi:hypothetical protein
MTEQAVLETLPEKESVCTSCIHFSKIEDSFFCKLLAAFLSEETFDIPCEFKESIE